MRSNHIYTGFWLMTVLCTGASAAPFDSIPMIDRFVSAEMSRQKIPGMALAVVKNGEVVTAKGYWACTGRSLADKLDLPEVSDGPCTRARRLEPADFAR